MSATKPNLNAKAHTPAVIEARDLIAVVDQAVRQPRATVRTAILDRAQASISEPEDGDAKPVDFGGAHAADRKRSQLTHVNPHRSLGCTRGRLH